MQSQNYKEYLNTKRWKDLAQKRKALVGNRCQLCNETGILHLHHRTYENLGCEKDEDLIVLCAKCHFSFHVNIKSPRWMPIFIESSIK